jgi:hypothetical protein
LFVEETLLLERTFAVPGPAALATEVITVPRDLEPDAIFTLELQNHGINSWRFGHIQLDITSL